MKAFRTVGLAVIAVALTGSVFAAGKEGSTTKEGQGRIGIGMNLSSAEATYGLDTKSAIGVGIVLDSVSGDSKSTGLGFTGWYQSKIKSADPVEFFFLAGLGYESNDVGDNDTTSAFNLFGGIGVEYFVPGTKSLSIEAKVGLLIQFLSEEMTVTDINPVTGLPFTATAKASSTRIAFEDLSGALFVIRYYIN